MIAVLVDFQDDLVFTSVAILVYYKVVWVVVLVLKHLILFC